MSLASDALALGVPVFPCGAGKQPIIAGGFKAATADAAEIADLFARPGAVCIGVPTGAASGWLVVDVDVKGEARGGEWLDANQYRLPPTRTVRTRSGGWHLVFAAPDTPIRSSAGRLAPGIDVRADGGYVIVPPSPGYSIEIDTPPVPVPDWLLEAMRPPPPQQAPAANGRHGHGWALAALDAECAAIAAAPFGQQESVLNRAALRIGQVLGPDLGRAEAAARLLDAARSMPYEAGREPWSDAELDAKIRRGLDDGARTPRGPEARSEPRPARERSEPIPPPAANPLHFQNPADLGHSEPVARTWIVDGWLPAGCVTLLYSSGGEGKSLLALQLATACATGREWLGLPVSRCRAMVLACEDDGEEMHRRQQAVNRELGVRMVDLTDLRWAAPVGEDNTLVRFGKDGAPAWTDRFRQVESAAMEWKPGLIVLDTAADLFGGSENDRGHVSQFLKTGLGGLARDTGAAVLLLAHPSRAGLATGDLDGGSTAWNGAVRSRWSLATPKKPDGTVPDPLARQLVRQKANYAAKGETITMRFHAGAMRRTEPGQDASNPVSAAFLGELDRVQRDGEWVTEALRSPRYAPTVFAAALRSEGHSRAELETVMRQMLAAGILTAAEEGQPAKRRRVLRRAEASV